MKTLTFVKNMVNGFRLAFFQQISQDHLSVAWWQVAVFGLASLLIPVFYDVVSIGLNGEVEWSAIPSAMAHLPIVLFAAIVVAYMLGRGDNTLRLLQIFLMIIVAVDLVIYGLNLVTAEIEPRRWARWLGNDYGYILVLPPIWLAVACAKAASEMAAVSAARKMIASIACAILLALPLTLMHRQRSLWVEPSESDESAAANEDGGMIKEEIFYNQAKVLERELAAVQRGRLGVIDLYFIGMGGFAHQDVFMKEVASVSRLFRERFRSEGKTIQLVNNRKSVNSSPIASVTSLRASLKRVAEVMNRDEDLLFLFLTSHGSETRRFSLDFWPLRFNELDPTKLRALLDESGIKNRVVVVSACYSGGFINALKNEHTLVISASAHDKSSFGCSNEADWTYFGKAYFDEALRKTYSFVEAFEIAKPVLAQREKKEGYTPSDPQMALGEGIKPTLVQLQQQLAARSFQ